MSYSVMEENGYLSTMSHMMASFREQSFLCDTKLVTSDREFSAHSVILAAASSVFRGAFLSSSEAGKTYRIEMGGIDSVIIESILNLIYTGNYRLESNDTNLFVATCEQLELDWVLSNFNVYEKSSIQAEDQNNMNTTTNGDTMNQSFSDNGVSLMNDSQDLQQLIDTSKIFYLRDSTKEDLCDVVDGIILPSCLSNESLKPMGVLQNNDDTTLEKQISSGSSSNRSHTYVSRLVKQEVGFDVAPVKAELDSYDHEISDADQQAQQNQMQDNSSKNLQCDICFKNFKYEGAFRNHCNSHLQMKASVCQICNDEFDNCQLLDEHIGVCHADEIASLVCDICNASSFDSWQAFKDHQSAHSEDSSLTCHVCKKVFIDAIAYKKHVLSHNVRKSLPSDAVRHRWFNHYNYLKKHPRLHGEKKNQGQLKHGKTFKPATQLGVHSDIFRDVKSESDFDEEKEILENKSECFKCEWCSKSFAHMSTLKNHLRVHTGEKPFMCTVCGKRFKDNCLHQHMLTHTVERKYACTQCDWSFHRHLDLQAHKATHCRVKQHCCSVCGHAFAKKGDLCRHMRIHTGERPYVCDTCGKGFKILFHLRLHSYVHSTDRPYSCTKCLKSFTCSVRLKKHEITHLGMRPHSCSICNRNFSRAANLRTHMKVHETPALNRNPQALDNVNDNPKTIQIVICQMDQSNNQSNATLSNSLSILQQYINKDENGTGVMLT